MASELKTNVTIRDMIQIAGQQLQDGDTAYANQVLFPLNDLLGHVRDGQIAVTDADTHVKHLQDAIVPAAGQTSITLQDVGADESLMIGLQSGSAALGTVLTADGSGGVSYETAAGAGVTDEHIRDVVVAMLQGSTDIILTEDDTANTLTITLRAGFLRRGS